jgi:2-polyprenyl-3-methyl-5-hydroxy-6-metoxy-1,4-benzoquinol methylase
MTGRTPASGLPARPCPVCGGPARTVLFEQIFEAVAGGGPMDRYTVVVCSDCGCGFADRIPEQVALDCYYRDASKYEHVERGGRQTDTDRERLAGLADIVAASVPPGSAILDVGCSTGALLALLRERGFGNVRGLDPSPACSQIARDLYDVDVDVGAMEDPGDEAAGSYDCLILAAVLEHVRDVAGFLAQADRWLKPNGYLVVDVPDASRFSYGVNAPFQEFSVEHINYFGPASLDNLMGARGFVTIHAEQVIREIAHGVSGAELIAVYRHAGAVRSPIPEAETERALRDYIELCRRTEDEERELLRALAESGRPVIVWGVGTHAQRLLATTPLAQASIVAFVDSSPKFQGNQLLGRPILAPQELRGRPEPILISSWTFFDEIESQIRQDLGLTNEIIRIH